MVKFKTKKPKKNHPWKSSFLIKIREGMGSLPDRKISPFSKKNKKIK